MHELIDQSYSMSLFGFPIGLMVQNIYYSGVFWVMSFLSLFTTLNPLGAIAFFVSHPDISNSRVYRQQMAKRTAVAVFIVLIVFAICGQVIFRMMGITISSFQLAGGAFVFFVALDMLRGANVRAKTLPEEREESVEKEDISIIPVAIPLLAGPGSITIVILIMSKAEGVSQSLLVLFLVGVVSYITYLILMFSSRLLRWIGESGVRVMNRVMGLFVGAIAVEMMIAGLIQVLESM